MKIIDFRSDTVTQPTAAMREAMMQAPVGDDVYGEDPTANALEEKAAALLGFEAALYGVSGTQTNLLGLMSHCERGHEVIVGQMAHTYRWEAGGMAVLGSIQPQPLEQRADGTMDLAAIEGAIKPDDAHYAVTKLIALENTWGGRVLPSTYIHEVRALATRRGLSTHLDGARLFNAAAVVAGQKSINTLAAAKGLGTPVGALLLGPRDLIKKARRLRKMIGGGMRQVGFVAAAGAYALEHHVDRLKDDHAHATRLANALSDASAHQLKCEAPQSNMVWVDVPAAHIDGFGAHLSKHGVKVSGAYGKQRWVTHLDIAAADIERAAGVVSGYFKG
jgi:threonine aldolase